MRRFFGGIMVVLGLAVLLPGAALAQSEIEMDLESVFDILDAEQAPEIPAEEFYRARVTEIQEEYTEELYPGYVQDIQVVELEIVSGAQKGDVITAQHGGLVSIEEYQKVSAGEMVVLVKTYKVDGSHSYYINDHYRLPALIWVLLFFIVLVLIFGRRKGLGALFGLAFSVGVLGWVIVPQIINGTNPLLVTIVGTFMIAIVSLYLAHGLHRRTTIAVVGTLLTLLLAIAASQLVVEFAHLFGRGTEEAFFIQVGTLSHINIRGLLLAGMVIGTLGVLDDITTAQVAVVGELKRANKKLPTKELYHRGLVVGREHIASLVNTLVLAYAGAALPLFILFVSNETAPLWFLLNGEMIAEEFVRTIVGSAALILAVPITTLLAAHYVREGDVKVGHVH